MQPEIPSYYHLPGDRMKPPVAEHFTFEGSQYCRFKAGKSSISYPSSLDVLMQDSEVIAEGDHIRGPYATDLGIAILLQTGPFTHIICDGKPMARIRAQIGSLDISGIRIIGASLIYAIDGNNARSRIGEGY